VIPKILSRENGEFSEISTTNLGHLGGKEGHILKIRFSTDELLLIYIYKCFNVNT